MDERLASARIAIVDDEILNVRVLERFLHVAGFTMLRSWTDPVQAVADLEEWRPDIVLLDLMMPEMDGFTVMQVLRERDVDGLRTPIVILTADVSTTAKERALGLGATDFLTKPFERTEINLRVRNILVTRFLEVDLLQEKQMLEVRVRERTADLRRSLDRLREANEERELLLRQIVTAQEAELQRVAEDIHDDTIQTVVALGLRLELARRKAVDPGLQAELDKAVETVRQATKGLRDLLFRLHPETLDRDGLAPALRAEAEHANEDAADGDPVVVFSGSLVEEPPLEARTALFRIAQEALKNALRHARATTIRIEVGSESGGVRLRVIDDGRGVDPEALRRTRSDHLGLRSMRERTRQAGGTFSLESEPGRGTTVDVWIPSHVADDAGDPDGAMAAAADGAPAAGGEPRP